MTGPLRLEPHTDPPGPPPDRGRLLTAGQVGDLIGEVDPTWVRRNVPHKLRLGHSTVRWFEGDVRAWLEELRTGAGRVGDVE